MALVSELIDVPFRGGLAQGVAPELVPAGGWLVHENVLISKEGEVSKRYGFVEETQTSFWGTHHAIGTHDARGELLSVAQSNERAGNNFYLGKGVRLRARDAGGEWQERGALAPLEPRRRALVRSHHDLDQSCVQVAVTGRYRLVAWISSPVTLGAGAADEVWIRVDDVETGHTVIRERRVSVPPSLGGIDEPGRLAVFVSASWFVVVWDTAVTASGTTFLRAWRVSTDLNTLDAAPTSMTAIPGARGLEWDACPLDGSRWVYVLINTTAVRAELYSVVTSTLVDTFRLAQAPVLATQSAPAIHARQFSTTTRILTSWIEAGEPVVWLTESFAWTVVGTSHTFEGGGTFFDRVAPYIESDATWCTLVYSGDRVLGKEETVFHRFQWVAPVATAWGTGSTFSTIKGQELWSRPWEPWDDGRVFVVTTSYVGTDKRDAGFQLVDCGSFGISNNYNVPPIWHGHLARYGGKGQPPLSPVRVGVSSTTGTSHLPVLVVSDETNNGQLDEIILYREPADAAGLGRSAQAQGLTVHTGSLTTLYDGERVLPAGFAEPPVITGASVSYQPTGLEGDAVNTNVYLYTAVYAYRDAAGNTHVSEPAPIKAVSISTGGGFTTAYVTLTIRYTSLWHGPEGDTGELSEAQGTVYVLLFRTVKNQTGPFYQRVTSVQIPNDFREYSTTYVDTLNDAGLTALGYGFLYTNGGVLPSQPAPPSCAAAVHGNRVWLVDAEDRRRVWFSRSLVPGEAPAFNEELTLRLDDAPDEITGIESLDSSLAVFTSSRIYLVDGDGPNDQGEGGAFVVRLLTTTSGCDDGRSLLRFEGGLLYRDPSGLQLLARGGLPAPVGDAVRDVLRTYPRVRAATHDAPGRRCLWVVDAPDAETPDARVIVFDYRHGSWGTWAWALPSPWAGVVAYGGAVAVHDGGRVLSATNEGYDDGDTWITMRVRTPWIRLASLAGYQRARRLVLQGEKLSDCTLSARLYLDHDGTTVQDTWAWDLGPSTTVTRLPQIALRAVLARQHGRSVAVEVWDSEPDDVSRAVVTGVRLFGLSLEIGRKPGPLWVSAGNKR
jgi:hypothetical protein